MTVLGYALSSEKHSPNDLVRYATLAEQAGFQFAMISNHFHPWTTRQGHAPLVWSVLGGIAHATRKLSVGTGVTCPIMRYHPAFIAQAAATIGAMMPGRFWLGLGSGERLKAGYDHVYIHQIGPDQEGFSSFTSARYCLHFSKATKPLRKLSGAVLRSFPDLRSQSICDIKDTS